MDVEQIADELGIRKPVTPDQTYLVAVAGLLVEVRQLLEQITGGTTRRQEETVEDDESARETEVREPEVPTPDEHRCDECGRTFANAGALGSHARSHTTEDS